MGKRIPVKVVDVYDNESTVVRTFVLSKIRWTLHALEGLAEREIDRGQAERTIREPTATIRGQGNRNVLMRRYHDQLLGQEMLLCVVTEDQADEVVIVTIYKTSKIEKHLKGVIS